MINFHYSDTWADPANQTKPAAWSSYTFDQLMSNVYWHTYNSLTTLKNAGITPKWVQVGNETNNGMLWPDGKASVNMKNFAWLINSGYDAVKAVNSSTKVIVHLANCENNSLYRWMFDGLKANGGKWDVVGASIYPTQTGNGDWYTMNNQCYDNLSDMVVSAAKSAYLPSLYCATFFAMGSSGTFQGSRASSFSRLSASPICASTWLIYADGSRSLALAVSSNE